jgi:hypothetical protein
MAAQHHDNDNISIPDADPETSGPDDDDDEELEAIRNQVRELTQRIADSELQHSATEVMVAEVRRIEENRARPIPPGLRLANPLCLQARPASSLYGSRIYGSVSDWNTLKEHPPKSFTLPAISEVILRSGSKEH